MIYPSADTIEDRVGSRYSLVVLAAKRAKQIKEGSPVLIDTLSTNPLTIALEEIAAGKVTVQNAPAIPAGSDTESVPEADYEGAAAFEAAADDNDEELEADESEESDSTESLEDFEDETANEDEEAESGDSNL